MTKMYSLRFVVVFAAIGWLGTSTVSAVAQTLPAGAGPQQMVPNGFSTDYPSTDASPGVYPSTTTPSLTSPQSYPSVAQNLMASAPEGIGGTASPAMPNAMGLSDYSNVDPSLMGSPTDLRSSVDRAFAQGSPWTWQLLPTGFMYKPHLADVQEFRFGTQWSHYRNAGWLWESTLGARVGILRYGTDDALMPQGWQWDFEGACYPKLDTMGDHFRLGIPITTRQGPFELKFGYFHLSSHIGDEYLLHNWNFPRINYVRESLIFGFAMYLNSSLRLYSEAGWAFYTDGGAEPWEFKFGLDYSSPMPTGLAGSPFFALNTHLREENDYSGNFTVMTGWQWRGKTGHLFRIGMQYFNGMSEQYQFWSRFEEQIGGGLWYDY
jgi:hypothetical protein